MDEGTRKWKSYVEGGVFLSIPSPPLAPALQCPVPHPADAFPELLEPPEIRGDSVVAVVPSEHTAKPRVLIHDGPMPTPFALLFETGEFRPPLLP